MSYSENAMLVGQRAHSRPRGQLDLRPVPHAKDLAEATKAADKISDPEEKSERNESAMGAVGSWTMKMQTPMGEQEAEVALNEDGTGSMKSMMGELELADVVYEGNDVSFAAAMGPISMDFAGTADGDTFTGTATSPMGESPVTGVRAS